MDLPGLPFESQQQFSSVSLEDVLQQNENPFASPFSNPNAHLLPNPNGLDPTLQSATLPLSDLSFPQAEAHDQLPPYEQKPKTASPKRTKKPRKQSVKSRKSAEDNDSSEPATKRPRKNHRRVKNEGELTEDRIKNLERNRAAATRCREKKKQAMQELQRRANSLTVENQQRLEEALRIRQEVMQLKAIVLAKKGPDALVQMGIPLEDPSVPTITPPEANAGTPTTA